MVAAQALVAMELALIFQVHRQLMAVVAVADFMKTLAHTQAVLVAVAQVDSLQAVMAQ